MLSKFARAVSSLLRRRIVIPRPISNSPPALLSFPIWNVAASSSQSWTLPQPASAIMCIWVGMICVSSPEVSVTMVGLFIFGVFLVHFMEASRRYLGLEPPKKPH